jgi:predicted nucleic acid-binding protein
MICADTSSFIAFINGERERDVELVAKASQYHLLVLAPVSVTELLSDPSLTSLVEELVLETPRLEIKPGYWERAGKLRALLMRHGYRPKTADTLIAQCCLDDQVPLVTRDEDFLAFQKLAPLRLL